VLIYLSLYLQPRFQLRFSFAIISVLTGVTTTYNTGLCYGGPVVSMTLGWLVVAAFNGCVTLSTAEICSAYPTSGGLYYWSAKLAGKTGLPLPPGSLDGTNSSRPVPSLVVIFFQYLPLP
jgi:amino acid transporter